jgi:hypothetical protein
LARGLLIALSATQLRADCTTPPEAGETDYTPLYSCAVGSDIGSPVNTVLGGNGCVFLRAGELFVTFQVLDDQGVPENVYADGFLQSQDSTRIGTNDSQQLTITDTNRGSFDSGPDYHQVVLDKSNGQMNFKEYQTGSIPFTKELSYSFSASCTQMR